jgi:hypothetical protein
LVNPKVTGKNNIKTYIIEMGAWGGVVVKALRY